jgi:hypothetical protein
MGKGLLPKRPPISIEWFYPSTYMQDMKEYLNAHGTKNIPQNRIRDCLAEQCIVSKGGKRILQWRWEQFVKGKPVRRTTEFLKI